VPPSRKIKSERERKEEAKLTAEAARASAQAEREQLGLLKRVRNETLDARSLLADGSGPSPTRQMSGWQKVWLVVGVLFVVGLAMPDDSSSPDSDTGDYSSDYSSDNPARQRCLDGLANVESWDDLDSTLASSDCAE